MLVLINHVLLLVEPRSIVKKSQVCSTDDRVKE
jgi:hypothetical protein